MRKRLLSMLLAFAMVLGILPMLSMEAAADEPASVTVYLSMSEDAEFMTGAETAKPIVMMPVTVPYFDLALYGLEEYYFSSEEYESDGGDHSSDLEPGTAEFAKDKVTLLHLYIYATELFYCGEDEGGKGYLYEEGMMGTDVLNFSGGVGSSFITQMWGEDCNLQYYVNYVYPLASEGWGATSDQILLEDGDIVTLGHFTSWNFYADSTAIFNYITAEKNTVTQGEQLALRVLRAGKDPDAVGENYDTVSIPVTSCPTLYYAPVDDIPSGDVTSWGKLSCADEEGNYMLDTTGWEPGTYMIAIPGQYGCEYPDEIVSTPGGMLLTVEAAESEEDVAVDTSKLNGTLTEENISFSGDTMTIAPAENTPACVVLFKNGDTYTRVAATENGDKYDFDVSELPEGASIVVAVKGDANCDGVVNVSDYTAIARSLLQTNNTRYQALEGLNFNVGDANGDGSINVSDYTAIARSLLQTSNARYAAISW